MIGSEMHPNPAFHTGSDGNNLTFARDRAFGVLSVNGAAGPLAAHVPFILSQNGETADLHLMRSNPITRALCTPLPALLAISGPDGYISPDWYGAPDLVPTWNYGAVHLRGRLELLDQDELPDLLARQSEVFEKRLAPKPVWKMDKVPEKALARMMRMICPLRFHVESSDGTWKFGQNKPEAARKGAADRVETGFGQELSALAQLMRETGPQK